MDWHLCRLDPHESWLRYWLDPIISFCLRIRWFVSRLARITPPVLFSKSPVSGGSPTGVAMTWSCKSHPWTSSTCPPRKLRVVLTLHRENKLREVHSRVRISGKHNFMLKDVSPGVLWNKLFHERGWSRWLGNVDGNGGGWSGSGDWCGGNHFEFHVGIVPFWFSFSISIPNARPGPAPTNTN